MHIDRALVATSLRAALALAALVGLPALGRATTFVGLSNRDLIERSSAIVIGTVSGLESAPDGHGGVNTYVHLACDEVLKGGIEADEIVLRERGGALPGRAEWVFGNADYGLGEQVLVFLETDPDGSLRTTGLSLGKFHLSVDRRGRPVATRDASPGAVSLNPRTGRLQPSSPQTTMRLAWLRARLRAGSGDRSRRVLRRRVLVQPPELTESLPRIPTARFSFLGTPPARWFEPDRGRSVGFDLDAVGDLTLGLSTSRLAVGDALAAWSNVPSSSLHLRHAGLADAAPFGGCPDDNRIVFNDPFDEITDPGDCAGVLALGGFCTSNEERTVNGTVFRRIITGKITFNNGWGGCNIWNLCSLAEVATHELGHTIGFGHSADHEAIMNAFAHFDGRCARLADDDLDAVLTAYPSDLQLSPTATFTPSRTPTRMRTLTRTPTETRTPTRTRTPSATRTATRTRVPTRTRTATRTPTATRTRTSPAKPTAAPVTWPPSGGWLRDLLDALASGLPL
jgi:hypothetical protein